MLHGDWGYSFASRVDVDVLILQRLPVTLAVIGASQLLALVIALPVGVFAATRPYSLFDQIASTFACAPAKSPIDTRNSASTSTWTQNE